MYWGFPIRIRLSRPSRWFQWSPFPSQDRRLFLEAWRYFWRCFVLVRTGVLNPGLLAEPEQSQGIYLLTTPRGLLGSYRI